MSMVVQVKPMGERTAGKIWKVEFCCCCCLSKAEAAGRHVCPEEERIHKHRKSILEREQGAEEERGEGKERELSELLKHWDPAISETHAPPSFPEEPIHSLLCLVSVAPERRSDTASEICTCS